MNVGLEQFDEPLIHLTCGIERGETEFFYSL